MCCAARSGCCCLKVERRADRRRRGEGAASSSPAAVAGGGGALGLPEHADLAKLRERAAVASRLAVVSKPWQRLMKATGAFASLVLRHDDRARSTAWISIRHSCSTDGRDGWEGRPPTTPP